MTSPVAASSERGRVGGVAEQVHSLTSDTLINEFCNFILSQTTEDKLPDWKRIDLMQVPKLVPHIFVHDYRRGLKDGMYVLFSGTEIDEHYGRTLQGKYFDEVYTGDDGDDRYLPLHYDAIFERRPFFARRTIRFTDQLNRQRFRLATVLYFPCSSDGIEVNFGIGIVSFDYSVREIEPTYLLL